MSEAIHASQLDVQGTLMYVPGSFAGRARVDTQASANNKLVLEPREISIRDVRSAKESYNLDEHGFAFVKHASAAADDPALAEICNTRPMLLPAGAAARYSTEMIECVRQHTGADVVLPQIGGFIARTSRPATNWTLTVMMVHGDYTSTSANQFLQWTIGAFGIPVPPHRYFAFIQTWRALTPGPQDNSLCMCDGRSVQSEDAVPIDAVTGPADVPGKCFEFRLCRYDASHSWYYLSNMEADDVVLFKGYDSRYPSAINAMHSAFNNPLARPDVAPRRSIEARFLAFFT
jgi:hypothetical protein